MTVPGDLHEDRVDQFVMVCRRDLAVVRQLTDIPEEQNPVAPLRRIDDIVVFHRMVERGEIGRRRRPGQTGHIGNRVQALAQRIKGTRVEIARPPLQDLDRVESVGFERLDQGIGKRFGAPRHAERAVLHVASGPSGNLSQFAWRQITELITVIFAAGRERHMIDIEIEPHSDGIGCNQEIDITGLIEFDLGIAGARTERAHHHGRAAALTAHQFGNRVDLVGRERHDGGTGRQSGDFFLSAIGEHRHARPRDHVEARDDPLQQPAHRRRPEQQRFLAAAQVQDPVGENMAPLQVTGQLHFVDGDKRGIRILRHCFNGTDPVARFRRQHFLFAGHQRHGVLAGAFDDLCINLPCQEPQRQADHAGFMAEHALDRQMGLARIRRSEHRRHGAVAVRPRSAGLRLGEARHSKHSNKRAGRGVYPPKVERQIPRSRRLATPFAAFGTKKPEPG